MDGNEVIYYSQQVVLYLERVALHDGLLWGVHRGYEE